MPLLQPRVIKHFGHMVCLVLIAVAVAPSSCAVDPCADLCYALFDCESRDGLCATADPALRSRGKCTQSCRAALDTIDDGRDRENIEMCMEDASAQIRSHGCKPADWDEMPLRCTWDSAKAWAEELYEDPDTATCGTLEPFATGK